MTVKDILNISFPAEFGSDEDAEETYAIEDVYCQLKSDVTTAYGASKFVIILNDDEVVKVPFNGSYWYDDEAEGGMRFDYFNNTDYCATELAVYNDAVALGVEKFFTSIKSCGYAKDGTPIYVAERVYTLYENDELINKTNATKDSIDKAEEIRKEYHKYFPQIWLEKAIEYYGEKAVIDLMAFIELEHINDFNTGNVGFRKDGSPVILDYSGYEEG